jgi:D-2-hydroxyacid dehydrogenase (NADP+)
VPRIALCFACVIGLMASASAAVAQATDEDCFRGPEAAALVERLQLRQGSSPSADQPGWAPPTRVATHLPQQVIDFWTEAIPGLEFVPVAGPSQRGEPVPGAQVYVGLCGPHLLETVPDVRWVQLVSAGADACAPIVDELTERGVIVTNMQRVHAPQIAEHAMAMTLSLVRGLHRWQAERASGAWSIPVDRAPLAGLTEIGGKTMLVVGLGGIGTETGRRAHALGMRIVATRNSRREGPDWVDYVGLADEVLALASDADVVVNATPLTPQTTGMFDAEFFDAMKETAYFINVGRGESADTDALVAALQSGSIAGAGLDVTDPEPVPPDHPLWTLPNVIVSPHVAASSDQLGPRVMHVVLANLHRYIEGARMLNVVNLARGY